MINIKTTISLAAIVCALFISSTAPINAQVKDNLTVDKAKIKIKPISQTEKPVRTFKISESPIDAKSVDVEVLASLTKNLEITDVVWNTAKKILTVEVENKNSILDSPTALVYLEISYTYMGLKTSEPSEPPKSENSGTGWNSLKPKIPCTIGCMPVPVTITDTVFTKYLMVKPLKPGAKDKVQFQVNLLDAGEEGAKQILAVLPDKEKRKQNIKLKIYPVATEK